MRGFRIELGEIEAALLAHPQVREAVVVALGDSADDRSLAAYFVAAGSPPPTAGELRDHLRARLAEPMVPASFTRLDRLPLTPNGKVERKALPPPETAEPRRAGRRRRRGFASPLEELLAGIWAEVLGRERAAAGRGRLLRAGRPLPARHPGGLAGAGGARRRAAAARAVRRADRRRAGGERGRAAGHGRRRRPEPSRSRRWPTARSLPLSFSQQRLWLLDRLEPGSTVYNLPLAYRIDGPLDARRPGAALAEVVRRHEVLRTTFAAVGESGEPRLVVAPPAAVPLPRVDLAGLPPAAREAEAERADPRGGAAALRPRRRPALPRRPARAPARASTAC